MGILSEAIRYKASEKEITGVDNVNPGHRILKRRISEPVGQQQHSSIKVDGGRTRKKEDQDAGWKIIRSSCSTLAGADGRKNDTKWIAPGIKRGWEERIGADNASPR